MYTISIRTGRPLCRKFPQKTGARLSAPRFLQSRDKLSDNPVDLHGIVAVGVVPRLLNPVQRKARMLMPGPVVLPRLSDAVPFAGNEDNGACNPKVPVFLQEPGKAQPHEAA